MPDTLTAKLAEFKKEKDYDRLHFKSFFGERIMSGYSFNSRMKTNAMTKALNTEIDWVSIRRRELAQAAHALKEVSSTMYANEVMISIMGELESGR